MQHYYTIPDAPDGYPLDPSKGLFSVVVPEATTNLCTNPSVETGTAGYTAVGGSIARSTTQQRRGVYSLAVTPTSAATDGVYFGTVSLTSGTTYTASVDVYGAPGVEYQLYFATTGGAALGTPTRFTGAGRWQRVDVQYPETSSTTRRVYIAKRTGASTAVFYVDGLQVEAKSYPTTYCDGDQAGFVPGQVPPPYLWSGTAHASTSSRSALTRAGGREYGLADLGLTVVSYTGLGMVDPTNIDDAYAQGDGGLFQATYVPARAFAIAGSIDGATFQQVQRKRAALQNAFRPDRGSPRQPLLLRYQNTDGCGNARGLPLELVCVYAGGLAGETTNRHQERVALRFTMYDPYLRAAGDSAASLSYQTTLTNANAIVQRSATGAWSTLSGGLTNSGLSVQVRALAYTPDGTLYAGGIFTNTGGGSGADYIARWSGSAWSVVGSTTALNGGAYALLVGPTGLLYVGGAFTNASGIANADYIATWDGSSWAALSTGANQIVYALAMDASGNLYAGGNFTDIGGSGADYIAMWDGAAWSVLGSATALNGLVNAAVIGPDGNLYVAGEFTNASGIASADYMAKWNIATSTWESIGAANGEVNTLAFGLDGTLYAGGVFTTIDGVSINNMARYNGTSWTHMGGATAFANEVQKIFVAPDGAVYIGGVFSSIGGVTLPDRAARWNGSSWVPLDIDYDGTPNITMVSGTPSGGLLIGYDTLDNNATAAAQTTVTNPGTADAYPIITFTGPGEVWSLTNGTLGAEIFFNLTLLASETAVLDLTPGNISFVSSFRGNILSTILPQSSLTAWRLASGANAINVLISGTTTAATAATLRFRPAYWSVDDGTE